MRRRGRPPRHGRCSGEPEAESQGSVGGIHGAGKVNLEVGMGDNVGHGCRREQAETPLESEGCKDDAASSRPKTAAPSQHYNACPNERT